MRGSPAIQMRAIGFKDNIKTVLTTVSSAFNGWEGMFESPMHDNRNPDSTCDDHFITYPDADLSGNPNNSRSTGGFAICIGGGAVQWGSRLRHVSLSWTTCDSNRLR